MWDFLGFIAGVVSETFLDWLSGNDESKKKGCVVFGILAVVLIVLMIVWHFL